MTINHGNEIPSIHVYYSSVLNDSSLFNHLLYGIEEEGIPYFLKKKEEQSAVELGYQAALDSRLSVGIGVGNNDHIVLHYSKLEKEEPLFQIDLKNNYQQGILGANAARLVKGIPFKSFEEREAEITVPEEQPQKTELRVTGAGQEDILTQEEIAEIVTIVIKILERLNPSGGER